jgi:hypothetical protein
MKGRQMNRFLLGAVASASLILVVSGIALAQPLFNSQVVATADDVRDCREGEIPLRFAGAKIEGCIETGNGTSRPILELEAAVTPSVPTPQTEEGRLRRLVSEIAPEKKVMIDADTAAVLRYDEFPNKPFNPEKLFVVVWHFPSVSSLFLDKNGNPYFEEIGADSGRAVFESIKANEEQRRSLVVLIDNYLRAKGVKQ